MDSHDGKFRLASEGARPGPRKLGLGWLSHLWTLELPLSCHSSLSICSLALCGPCMWPTWPAFIPHFKCIADQQMALRPDSKFQGQRNPQPWSNQLLPRGETLCLGTFVWGQEAAGRYPWRFLLECHREFKEQTTSIRPPTSQVREILTFFQNLPSCSRQHLSHVPFCLLKLPSDVTTSYYWGRKADEKPSIRFSSCSKHEVHLSTETKTLLILVYYNLLNQQMYATIGKIFGSFWT